MAPVHRVLTLMSSPFMRCGMDAGSLISSSKMKSGIYHLSFSPASLRSILNFHVPARFILELSSTGLPLACNSINMAHKVKKVLILIIQIYLVVQFGCKYSKFVVINTYIFVIMCVFSDKNMFSRARGAGTLVRRGPKGPVPMILYDSLF